MMSGLNGRVKHLERVIQVPQNTALVTAAIERVGLRMRARLEAFLAGSDPPVVDAAQANADRVLLESNGMSAAWASAADRFRQRIARLAERYAEGGEG